MPGRGCSGSRRGCAPGAATRRPALVAGRASGAPTIKPSGPRRCGRGARRAARAPSAGRRPATVRRAAGAAGAATAAAGSGGARHERLCLVQPLRRPPRHCRPGVDLSDLCCAAGAAAGPCAPAASPGPLPHHGAVPCLWTRAGPPRPARLPTLPEDAGGGLQSAQSGASAGP